jgi:hypothetical protein
MLEESFYNSGQESHEEEMKANAYKKQIKSMDKQLNILKNKILEKDEAILKLQNQIQSTNQGNNTQGDLIQYKFEIR